MTSRPMVAVVGNDMPRQLAWAAGVLPARMTGEAGRAPSAEAAGLLGAVDITAVRILDRLLDPVGPPPAAVVVCNDAHAHLQLFYVLRALGAASPPVHLLDVPRRDSRAARTFTARAYLRLHAFLAAVPGVMPAPLAVAASDEAAVGVAARRLRERRRAAPAVVSGAAAHAAVLAAQRLAPDAAVAALERTTAPPDPTARRVLLTGSSAPDAAVHAAFEGHGMLVVGDDHPTGDAAWLGAVPAGDDLPAVCDALAEAHFARERTSAIALSAERAATTLERARAARVDVVVSLVRAHDAAPLWDAADLRAGLDAAGIPLVALSPVDDDDPVAIAAAVATRLAEQVPA